MKQERVDVEGWHNVMRFEDPDRGFLALVSVHNNNLGPGLGGCRMRAYDSYEAGLEDVKNLSRGMTYKNALAGIPFGGGKSVIFGDPHKDKTDDLFEAYGEAINLLAGQYIGAQDSGITTDDLRIANKITPHLVGIPDEQGRGGNPSPFTSYGVWKGMKAAAQTAFGDGSLAGKRVAIAGVGAVGMGLAEHLHGEGAELIVADVYEPALAKARSQFNATVVPVEEIISQNADIFAPCALGGSINPETIETIKAKVIAGAANNQLTDIKLADRLAERGILYAPDYVINAAGVISVGLERLGQWEHDALITRLDGIGDTLSKIFARSKTSGTSTAVVADRLAEEIFLNLRA